MSSEPMGTVGSNAAAAALPAIISSGSSKSIPTAGGSTTITGPRPAADAPCKQPRTVLNEDEDNAYKFSYCLEVLYGACLVDLSTVGFLAVRLRSNKTLSTVSYL